MRGCGRLSASLSRAVCGGGLHGLKEGLGNWSLLDWDPNAIGVIFENVDCPVIDIDGEKVKVQKAKIIESGPLPTLLAKFLPNFIRELTAVLEIDVITVLKASGLMNDKDFAKIGSSGYYAKIGRAKVGINGAIALTYTDSTGRYRIAVGYEGEGLKADTWYSVSSDGEFNELEAEWGEHAPDDHLEFFDGAPDARSFKDGTICFKVGKKKAGRLLDGREWNEMPGVVA